MSSGRVLSGVVATCVFVGVSIAVHATRPPVDGASACGLFGPCAEHRVISPAGPADVQAADAAVLLAPGVGADAGTDSRAPASADRMLESE